MGFSKLVAICVIVAAAATLHANGIEPISRPAQAFFCGGSRAAGNRERWRPSLRCISEQARPWQHEGLRTSGRAIVRGLRSLEALGVIARLPIQRGVSTCGLDFDDDTSVTSAEKVKAKPSLGSSAMTDRSFAGLSDHSTADLRELRRERPRYRHVRQRRLDNTTLQLEL